MKQSQHAKLVFVLERYEEQSLCCPYEKNNTWGTENAIYRHTSNINRTLVGNKIVDHSYVVGATPVGASPSSST